MEGKRLRTQRKLAVFEAKRTLLIQHLRKIEAKQILFIQQIRIDATETPGTLGVGTPVAERRQ
jgi:hypothetical protein